MLRARRIHLVPTRLPVWQAYPILLLAMLTLAVALSPPAASAGQLTLTWVDTSGGEAAFSIERRTGTTGTWGEIAQEPPGVASHTDTTVALGTTYCYRVRAFDAVGFSDYSNDACGSLPGPFDLTVAKTGTGAGAVGSSPAGIDCGADCFESFLSGTAVTLTALPASGATFAGWSGGGCGGTDPCTLAGSGALTVSATFTAVAPSTYTLTVSKSGPGTVTSSPGGINCGSACSASYASGTVVVLTAEPGRGARFVGWTGGDCTGAGSTCTVTLNAAVSVSASFSKGGKK